MSNDCFTVLYALSAILTRSSLSQISLSNASNNSELSGFISNPLYPSSTILLIQPTFVATGAHPDAIASNKESEVPSEPSVGTTAISLSLCISILSSLL